MFISNDVLNDQEVVFQRVSYMTLSCAVQMRWSADVKAD